MKKLLLSMILILATVWSRGSPAVESLKNDFFTYTSGACMVVDTPVSISDVVINDYICFLPDTDQFAVVVYGVNFKFAQADNNSESELFFVFLKNITDVKKSASGGTDIKKEYL